MKNAGSGHQGTSQDILNALSETGLGPTKEELTPKHVEQAQREITELSRRAAARAHQEKFAKKPEPSRRFFSFFCCCFSAESENTAYIELMDLHRIR